MPNPIDQSFFKEDWEIDRTPTVPYDSDDQPPATNPEKIRTDEALEAYATMKLESAKHPISKMRMKAVQQAVAQYLISIADANILANRGKRGERVSFMEVQNADQRRGSAHNALMRACDALGSVLAEFKLDTSWQNVVGLQTREEVTHWAVRVGSAVAADLAREAH